MTVAELGERMSAREMVEWQILDALDPFGEKRDDYRAALIAQHIVNVHMKRGQGIKLEKFLLDFTKDRKQKDTEPLPAETLMAKFKALFPGKKGE